MDYLQEFIGGSGSSAYVSLQQAKMIRNIVNAPESSIFMGQNTKPSEAHPESAWTEDQRAVIEHAYPSQILDDPRLVKPSGRPIVDVSHAREWATDPTKQPDSEAGTRDLLELKKFQLEQKMNRIERRDGMFGEMMNSHRGDLMLKSQQMGTPYPIIEPFPHIYECWEGVRWYEHGVSLLAGYANYLAVRLAPYSRTGGYLPKVSKFRMATAFMLAEFVFCQRSHGRLIGTRPNEREAYKYGIMETRERLQRKSELWHRYGKFKEEWCRRYDYYVWGMRPGERTSIWSYCNFRPAPVKYNTKFDYPPRKNPFWLSAKGVETARLESGQFYHFAKGVETELDRQRPELKYIYGRNAGGIAT